MSGEGRRVDLGLDRNLVLSAGAGTGKTQALVTVALGLYGGAGGRAPLEPQRVWAVTFTDKAAAELRERVATRLRALVRGGGDLSRHPELEAALGPLAVAPGRWEEVLASLPGAPIGTFHALCGQLLRRYSAEARLDPRARILDEPEAAALYQRAREQVLLGELGDADGEARQLVRNLGSLADLRRVLGDLHRRLAEEGREPDSLVRDTSGAPLAAFDPDRLSNRVEPACAALAAALGELAGSSQDRLLEPRRVLESERGRLGSCSPARLGDWYAAAAAVCEAAAGNLPQACRPTWSRLKQAWDGLRTALAEAAEARLGRGLARLVHRVAAAYAEEKRRARVLDFADLVLKARDLLRDHLELRGEVKRHVGALLIDEFQDTNQPQLELVHLLAESRDRERPLVPGALATSLPLEPATLCVVGDHKQSIYEFRGADVSLFAGLLERARRDPDFRVQPLARSWRARPDLVRFQNALFARVMRPGDRRYQVGFSPSEDALEAERAEPASWLGHAAVQLLEGTPGLDERRRRALEAGRVAAHLRILLASGRTIEEKDGRVRPLRGSDVAILLAAYTGLPAYQRALEEHGLGSVVLRGRGFHGAREVRDLLALLAAVCDPFDRFASAAVLRSPAAGLSDDALVLLAQARRLELGWHRSGCTVPLEAAEAGRLARLARLVARLERELDRLGPAKTLELAIEELDLLPAFASMSGGAQRLANVRKLLGELDGLTGAGAAVRVRRLLALADDLQDREPPADAVSGEAVDAVRIMTIHAAKGLEFPVVILPELSAGEQVERGPVFFDRGSGLGLRTCDRLGKRLESPHLIRVLDELKQRRAAERARLFYVAATRARDLLVLCGEPGARAQPGSFRSMLDAALGEGGLAIERVAARVNGDLPPPLDSPPPSVSRSELDAADATLAKVVVSLPHLPAPFVSGVTELEALEWCERRYFYRAVVGLEEHPERRAAPEEDGEEAGVLERLQRGTLAHLLLERLDLPLARRAPELAVAQVARAAGLDPAWPEVAPVTEDLRAFLGGELGRALVAAETPRIFRELPFALEVHGASGATLMLKGRIDLLFIDGEGVTNVVDYKYGSRLGQPASAYQFQLRTYALAVRRLLPDVNAISAGLVWLRDRLEPVVLEPIGDAEMGDHQRRLETLVERLSQAKARQSWAKLSAPASCAGCGFTARCWGLVSP